MNGDQWWLMLDKAGFQTAWLLLSALWQSSILLAAAGVLAYALRRRRASVRYAVLAAAILCSPLIPLLGLAASRSGTPQAPIPVMPAYSAPLVPAYSAPDLRTYPVPAMPAAPVLTEAPAGAEIDRAPAAPAVMAQPQEAPLALLDCPWALALLAYAAGAGGLMCLVAVGKYRIGRWARLGRVVTDPRVLGIFRDARRRLGLARDFTVVENERTLSPMTVGTLHPVILLPAGLANDSSDEDLLAVALHELKHVQRCDSLLLTLLSVVRAVLFFHPLVWLACRQASDLAESACDDAVLQATGRPVPYARMLARLAEQLPRHAFATELAAGIVWSKGAFLRRVEAILSDRRAEIRKLSRAALLATLLAAMTSVALALALPLGERGQGQAAANSATTQPTPPQPASAQSVPRAPSLELKWQKDLSHQFEAGDCFVRDGHLYVGSGKVPARIIKLRLTDGHALWTHEVENASYQPSYPVSNGKVVVLGTYSRPRRIVGLDDRTGKQLWAVPTEEQNMSAACFAGDVAFIGSYDRHLYAIDTAKGLLLWKRKLGLSIRSRPAVVDDLVLVGCYDGFLYALKQADGEIAWKVACGGRIDGDVVVADNLALVRMDDQTADQPYKTDRAGKIIIAVDIAKHELAGKWKARQSWGKRILLDGDDAYFFEQRRLCSLDLKTCKLNWEYIASPADPVLAAPVLLKDHVLLPLNVMGREGQHRRQKVLLSKANGNIVARGESGGVGSRWDARYVQADGLVALTSPLQAYRIEAGAQQPPASKPAALAAGDPRRGAAVTVELGKTQYYLGENVLLKWRIRNAGDQSFKVSMGGDGRTPWAKRAIRFKVESLDEQGRKMDDPYPNPMNMGGPGNSPTLEPGQDFRDNLQLMRYREFPGAGKYTIKVYHDLGWEKDSVTRTGERTDHSAIPPGGRLAPVATTTVRLVMPDRRQARQVVDAMLALPADAGRTWGKWGKPFADFELLRYPVYLPIMKELAHKGDARGLDAIGAMAFPEATAALLELMNHKNPAIAAKAGDLLLWRMPYVHHAAPSRRDYLSERSWTDELKKAALVPAWKLLDGNGREGIIRGARLVQSLGGKDDLPALIKVMDRVLAAFKDDPTEQAAYLRPATASRAVVDAAGQLIGRGARPSMSAATPGQAVAFLIGLRLQNDFRPEGWRELATGLIDHKIPFLRYVALQTMPLPLDDAAIAAVARAIKDEFAPVQGAACDLAEKAKSPVFGQPLLDVLKTTDNHWVLRSDFLAAAECGIDNDLRLEVCVGRMGRHTNDMNMLLLSLLIDGSIEHEGGRGSQSIKDWTSILPGIQKAWMDFIAANRQALRAGKRFRIAQPPVTAGMFPPGFYFHRAGKSAWPPPPPPTPLTPLQLDHQESQSYDFMKRSVLSRLKAWRKSQPKTAAELEKYATEIVINLDPPEVLLKDGTDRVRRSGLSGYFAWTVYRVTPEGAQPVKAPVRLRLPGLASQPNICKEVFVLQGKLEGGRGVFADITTHDLRFSAGKGVADLAGYQFPEKEYASTSDTIEQSLLIARPVMTAPPAATQPAQNLRWGDAVDGIRCAVRPTKASFAPDEDIVVDVIYSNASEGPITVCVCPDQLYTWVALRVRDDKGKSVAGRAHGTGTRPPLKMSDFVTLLPGQAASFRQVIRYNPKAPVKPGRYLVQAEINKINRMDKHLLGLREFIRKYGVPEPWCSAIQSPKTPITIAARPVVKTGGESVRAVGGYDSPRVDKATWGDMELVLELPKARYDPNEAIPVKLMIRNTGRKAIRLDGILPMRSSANPPSLDIEAPGPRLIRLHHGDGIVRAVRNEKAIVVEPNETVVLIDADLRSLSGTVQDDKGEPRYQKVLAPFFGNGEYTIRGTFMPTPQVYSSSTPKARFWIGARTQPAAGAAEIDRLIKQLGSEKVAERKESHATLIRIGRPAEARLLAAARDAKLERARRAELARQEIEAARLQVKLTSVEQLWTPGDTPRVRLEVRNIGDQPMRLMPLRHRGKLLNVGFRVRMLGEAGPGRDCGSQAVPVGWAAPEPVEVRPGEALTVENQCMPSPDGATAGKPWEVIAEYVTSRGKVVSASVPIRFRYLAKVEFRIAPRPSAMGKAELRSCMDWLKAGRVGFWWKGGRIAGIAGRLPKHAWLPIAGELTGADQLVTGEYKGRKYVLVSDKPGQIMVLGQGKDAWWLANVYATADNSGSPAVGFELDARGAELFAALTKANIRNALAIVIDGEVISAPMLMSPMGKKGMITGRFSEQEVKDLVNGLKAGMPQTPDGASTQPAAQPSSRQAAQPAQPVTKAEIDERIRALGSAVYKDRERAQQWLIDLGDEAADALRAAAKGEGEAAARAKSALVEIGRRRLAKFFVGMPVGMPPGVPDSPEAPVRLAWIKALGTLKDLRTTGILLDCLDDKGDVREAAGEVLREMSGQTFADDPKQWRSWWAQVQSPTESAAALLGRLDDPRVEVRREAIWKLAMLGDPKTLDVLVERFVNRAAGEPRGKSVMEEKMQWADLPHLRAALVCMGPAAGARMVRVSGYGWRIREPALATALQIGGQAVIDEAIRQVQGEDQYGRNGGAKVLTELRPLSGVLPLMRALDNRRFHDNVIDRALVAYDKRSVPYLRKAWEDESLGEGTRLAAAVLLAHHGDDVGMSALVETAAKGKRLLMIATVSRMGETRNPKFLPLIAKALARKDSQQVVAYAAAFCGGKDALPMLRQALSHPDKGVRYGAQVWVEKLSQAEDASDAEERRKLP